MLTFHYNNYTYKNMTVNAQEFLEKLDFPKKILKSEKVSVEGDKILFPVSNSRGVENNYIVELNDENELFTKLEFNSTASILGLYKNSFTTDKEIYITASPLDRLTLLSLGLQQTICIAPELLSMDKDLLLTKIKVNFNLDQFLKVIIVDPSLYELSQFFLEDKVFKVNLFKLEQEINSSLTTIKNNETVELDSLYQLQTIINKDLISQDLICNFIKNSFENFPIGGIVEFDDEIESIVDSTYANGIQKGVSTGYDNLDQYLRPKTKNIMLVYGIPSHGKSLFVKNLCLNLAKTSGWKTGFFVPEEEDAAGFYTDLVEKNMGKLIPFYTGNTKKIHNDNLYLESKKFVKEHAKYISPFSSAHEEDSLDKLIDTFKKAVKIHGLKCLVIDPWNHLLMGKPKQYSESEFLTIRLNQLNRLAHELDVFIIVVSHPKITPRDDDGNYKIPTLYDVSGGAQWYNMFSLGVCIYRLEDKNSVSQNLNKIQNIFIQKVKHRSLGKCGACFLVTLDNSETLIDAVDSNAFFKYLDNNKREKTSLENMINAKKTIIKNNSFVETLNNLEGVVKTENPTKIETKRNKKLSDDKLPF